MALPFLRFFHVFTDVGIDSVFLETFSLSASDTGVTGLSFVSVAPSRGRFRRRRGRFRRRRHLFPILSLTNCN